jgi:virulence factor Mce-like protein
MSSIRDRLRNITDPVQSRQRSVPLRSGFILLGVIGLVVYMAMAHDIPIINGKPGERLRADFAFANQVIPGQTPVRVDGVPVGEVDKVEAGPDARRSTRVEMRITEDDLVIHEDARAEIRWRTLLGGNMYIDLEPGSARAGRLGDGVIPVTRTASQAELDDLLQPYDGGTEQAQRDILRGAGQGLADAPTVRRAIDALPALETVGRGLEPVQGSERADLRKLVDATATTVEALGTDTAALQGLVTGARQTLGATAARRAELGQFLDLSPSTLDETLSTMDRLRTTLDHLDPLVDDLRPGARDLAPSAEAARPALAEADALLAEARPVLRDLRPALDDLGAAARAGVPVIDGLEPTVDRLNQTTLPWLTERDEESELRNFEAIGPFFSVLSMAAAEFDAVGHRLHLSTPGASNSVITLFQLQFTRACAAKASNERERVGCRRMGKVLASGWFGRGKVSK